MIDSACGGSFLADTDGSTCCQAAEAGGLGGGGYSMTGLDRCIFCDRGE